MKSIRTIGFVLLAAILLTGTARAQEDGPPPARQQQQQDWPRSFTTDDGTVIKIYEPQPEAFADNVLKSRWAISVTAPGKDPVFGTFWSVANVETDRDNRRVIIQSVRVPNVKFPGQTDDNFISSLKTALETNLPSAAGDLSLDELLSSLDMNTEQKKLSKDLNTSAPRIIYSDRPALLVMIDGQPKLQQNKDWNLDVVVNTPFTIVKANNGGFYLYGGKHWYQAQSATGPYSPANNVPSELGPVKNAVDNANSSNAGYIDSAAAQQDSRVSDIIVSTSPAELIQTDGKPNFTAIAGTSLSYANNSSNDLFQDGGSGKYFVLIAGRWYSSGSLTGGWHYIASNSLPADFAKIPEGSPKDNVLASVAGTDAAREAIMDAQVPQTAKVDRNSASASVNYNGEPQFSPLQGTDMQYATNTSSSVILDHGIYYTVDNGVWFQAPSPNGPWTVATERPDEVDRIPPASPLYNTKYVYIYDVTPDYVYMGYTPGYLNTYIYGPTVVYGTGFYYDPWYNGYYYPRPWTWGFNVCYNPWAGWTLGYGYGFGWFHFGLGFHAGWGGWGGWGGGGWWGAGVYRPVYAWNRYRSYGFYGANYYRNRNVYVTNNFHTNIYAGRGGVITRDNHSFYNRTTIGRGATFSRPGAPATGRPGGFNNGFNNGGRPVTPQSGRPGGGVTRPGGSNNVFSDRSGNVYQRNQSTNQWQQRSNNSWQPVRNNPGVQQNLNREQQMRDRGFTRQQNFQQSRSFGGGGGGGGFSRPSGGGGGGGPRPSGGGGRPGRH